MHFHVIAALTLAGHAAAETAVILNPWAPEVETMTVRAVLPNSITVYENVCPPPTSEIRTTTDFFDDLITCLPFTVTQGPSTWEYHLTDPTPGLYTMDANCKFPDGESFTAGEGDCTIKGAGESVSAIISYFGGGASTTGKIPASDWSDGLATPNTVELVTSLSPSSTSAPNPTGSNVSKATPTDGKAATTTDPSGAASFPRVTGGAMAMAGGAVGIAAALAAF